MSGESLIVLDYDNTLVDFTKRLLHLFNTYYMVNVKLEELLNYDFTVNILSSFKDGINGAHMKSYFLDNESKCYQDLDPFPECHKFLKRMSKLGFDIHILTARRDLFKDETLKNLKENKFTAYVNEFVFTHEKAEYIRDIKHQYDDVIFIDDKAEEVERSVLINPEVQHFVRSMPYNSKTECKRIDNLFAIFQDDEKKCA